MNTSLSPQLMTAAPPPPARGAFLRAVLVLVSGTALAHGLTAAALPVLSRLYSPAEFGLLAVFSSFLGIISIAACLRYELAIPLPQTDQDALHLLVLSMLCCTGLSLVLGLLVALVPQWLLGLLGQPQLGPYLWLAPLGLLLAGAYSALQFWHVRGKHFTLLARTRIAQSAGSAATQVGLGWAGMHPLGLLLGYVMNTGIACLGLGGALLRALPSMSWSRIGTLALEYRRFPLFSTIESLANSAAIQVPVIMIAALATPSEAGYLMMAMYVAQAPMSLIGTAIGQVYLSRAPTEYRQGHLGPFTVEIFSGLFKAGAGPMLATGILAPLLFGQVLGSDWQRAGVLVLWMTPWFLLQFLAVPVGLGLHVTGHLRAALLLQSGGFAFRVAMVWGTWRWHALLVSEAYAVSGAIFYLGYLIAVMSAVRADWRSMILGLRRGAGVALLWAAGAAILALCILLLAPGKA
ncbi:lipopolysaccharide biosynthesis protein [Paucibacter soli]|uniref:lipopolysaccharide biosynthesis protein n=1 Tax=Paucibacter soli TaxID=3133433 RepID=UPI0030B26D41